MYILVPVLVFGIIALIMGLVLGIASKIFAVKTDERIELVAEKLPGANCGGCGYSGCSGCASAIVSGEAKIDACPSCADEAIKEIAKIMGVTAGTKSPMAAFVKCSGSIEHANYKYFFDGTKSCHDISSMNMGDKMCRFACLGYGDCVEKCNFGALSVKDSLAQVDINKCTGCGMCVKECPKGVIELMPKDTSYYVKCVSKDKGIIVKDACKVGCIGCKICEKNCPSDAIHVVDNLAVIDVTKCTQCGTCVEKCPRKIIIRR